tara:strand:- start:2436 stop:3506 length:1071 start_codon:yes stop_codon:yes gene_type:complete
MSKKYTAIDLFSGCGGFSYGFQQADFHVVLGVDNTDIALETFKKNHKKSKTLNLDLHLDESIEKIVSTVDGIDIDVIIAGPPCQGFSLTGTRDESDERNTLFNAVFKVAKKLNPKALIIENVVGLMRLYDGKASKEIIKLCDDLGYTCNPKILFAPDYGVPQIRKRVFFVALRKDLGRFEFPEPLLSPDNYIGCEAAIGDLPTLEEDLGGIELPYSGSTFSDYQKTMKNGCDVLFNHVGTRHTDHVINVISQVPEGGNHKDLPPGVGDSRKFNEAWTRYHSKKPSKTIDTGHRNHFHYKWDRVPTVRENARLQSFPDSFVFLGTKTQQNRQVGNAVPPLLGKVLGNKIKQYFKNES